MLHGYQYIKSLGRDVEFIVLLQCNAPFILPRHLSEGIQFLRQHPEFDSAATVSEYSVFAPARARLIFPWESRSLLAPLICSCVRKLWILPSSPMRRARAGAKTLYSDTVAAESNSGCFRPGRKHRLSW